MMNLSLSYLVTITGLTVFIFSGLVPLIAGADPTYSPQTISDTSGNTADNYSNITWANLPAGGGFDATNPTRVSEGLKAYYDFVHNFINSVFSNGIPDGKR